MLILAVTPTVIGLKATDNDVAGLMYATVRHSTHPPTASPTLRGRKLTPVDFGSLLSFQPHVTGGTIGTDLPQQSARALTHVADQFSGFIQNAGQWDSHVLFASHIGSNTLWLSRHGLVFENVSATQQRNSSLHNYEAVDASHSGPPGSSPRFSRPYSRLGFFEEFRGGNLLPMVDAIQPTAGRYNFIMGSDPSKWRTNISAYNKVTYRNIWTGIDFSVTSLGETLEQEFVIKPEGDVTALRMTYRGIDRLSLDPDGSLVIHTALGELRETPPVIYQIDYRHAQKVRIGGAFRLLDRTTYGFTVSEYSRDSDLVIDPTLSYSTYLSNSGPNGNVSIEDVAVDSNGSAIVTGWTGWNLCGLPGLVNDFPVTPGAFQSSSSPQGFLNCTTVDAFVSKFTATGDALVYSTFLGGSNNDTALSIEADASGSAIITGHTSSADFPTTAAALLRTLPAAPCSGGIFDAFCGSAFVTKLDSLGYPVFSTYLGGLSGALGRDVTVDSLDNIYVVGQAGSSFPVTPSAYRQTGSAFLVKLNPSGTGLVYSTFLGSGRPNAISVNDAGEAFIVGGTFRGGIDPTPGAFETDPGFADQFGFAMKISAGGTTAIYATLLGCTVFGCSVEGTGVAVDGDGNAYVAGQSSAGFPVTPGALQTTPESFDNFFVAKLNSLGNGLIYATYLGHLGATTCGVESNDRQRPRIKVDTSGAAYVVGCTYASVPITLDGFQVSPNTGMRNAFLDVLDATGTQLLYGTYLHGSSLNDGDSATGVALDAYGAAYVSGFTTSVDFPTTPGTFQEARRSGKYNWAGFLSKLQVAGTGVPQPSVRPMFLGTNGIGSLTVFFPRGIPTTSGLSVTLTGTTQPAITSNSVMVLDANHLLATFDFTGAPSGVRNVVIADASSVVGTVAAGVDLVAGGAPSVWVDVVGGPEIRAGMAQDYFLVVGNRGTADTTEPFTVWVTVSGDVQATFPAGMLPSISQLVGNDRVFAFDIVTPVVVQGIKLVPMTLSANGHAAFTVSAWIP
jgi:hypothetical protein